MHDGSMATLLDVVNHYNAIPAITQGLDRRLAGPPPRPGGAPTQAQRLNLSENEKGALVDFLGTLTGSNLYRDEKWSSPFDENHELAYVVLPAELRFSTRNEAMTLEAKGVPRVTYLLKSSVDLKTWDYGVEIEADENGLLSYEMQATPKAKFFCFVYDPGE
jgi:cytochrome c peroxidase